VEEFLVGTRELRVPNCVAEPNRNDGAVNVRLVARDRPIAVAVLIEARAAQGSVVRVPFKCGLTIETCMPSPPKKVMSLGIFFPPCT
jgi:hypothetical protein